MPSDPVLDRSCLTISEGLAEINELKKTVDAARANAMARMESVKRTSYVAHGAELTYKPGHAKLNVRLVDSDAGADAGDGAGADDAGGE